MNENERNLFFSIESILRLTIPRILDFVQKYNNF